MLVPGQLFHLQPDVPAGGRILDRIGEDVHQHLIQTVGVGQHVFVLQIGAYRKGLTALTCLLPDDAVQLTDLLGQIHFFHMQGGLAALDAAHIQNIVDDAQQQLTGAFQLAQMLGKLFRLVQLVFHQGGDADDGVHGGADIVAHVGEEVRLGFAGTLGGLQRLGGSILRPPHLVVGLRQLDVILLQTEVRLFFSLQLPLLLFPQKEPASNDCHDRKHRCKAYNNGHDDIDQLLRIHGHIFCWNKERQRPLGVFHLLQGVVILSSVQHSVGITGACAGKPLLCYCKGRTVQIGHLGEHGVYVMPLQQLSVIGVEQLEAVIIQHIDAVVIFVGVAAEIIVQLGHTLGDAKVAQGDLFLSALQCDRGGELFQKHHPGVVHGQRIGNIADPLRRVFQIVHFPQQTRAAILGIITPGSIHGDQFDLFFMVIGKLRQLFQIAVEIGIGLQRGVVQIITLHIHLVPVVVDHILQTVEHLVGDLFHLAQTLVVDKVLDVGLAHDKKGQDQHDADKAEAHKQLFIDFVVHIQYLLSVLFNSMRCLPG